MCNYILKVNQKFQHLTKRASSLQIFTKLVSVCKFLCIHDVPFLQPPETCQLCDGLLTSVIQCKAWVTAAGLLRNSSIPVGGTKTEKHHFINLTQRRLTNLGLVKTAGATQNSSPVAFSVLLSSQ